MNASKLLIQYKEGQRNFYGAALKQANLAWAKLPLIHLDEADLQKADLRNANLAGANLNHADFSSANLADVNFMGADLIRAKLAGANLVRALMSGANLSGANLRKTDLTNASLVGANLSGADFSGAILNNTNLSGANLKGANLSNTDLDNVDLEGLDLEETILSEVQSARLWQANQCKFQETYDSVEEYAYSGGAAGERVEPEVKLLTAPDMDPFALDPFLSPAEEADTIVASTEDWSDRSHSVHQDITLASSETLPSLEVAAQTADVAWDSSPTTPVFDSEELPSGPLQPSGTDYKTNAEQLEKLLDAEADSDQHSGIPELETLHGMSDEHLEMVAAHSEPVVPRPARELPHASALDNRNSKVVQSIQAVLQRRVQQSFQQALMEAYNYQCAITGCRIGPLLEATFIKRQEASDADHPSNGLILRTDLRNLYRLHLIAIDPHTFTVLTAPSLAGSDYRQLQGKPIFLPTDKAKRPDQTLLAEHLQACKWYSTQSTPLPEIDEGEVAEPSPFAAASQYPQQWLSAVKRKPKVALGVTGLLVAGSALWAGYNATHWLKQATKPQLSAPAIASTTTLPSLQGTVYPINVAIGAVTYPKQGIIANQSAYVPVEIAEQLGVKPAAVATTAQAVYKGKAYLKANSLKPLGVDLEWKPENRTMFLDADVKPNVQPINIEIKGASHPQAGLIISQSAYVPLALANQLPIDFAQFSASDRMQYGNETYLKATKLKESQVAVNWDGKTRTMALNPQ